MRMSQSMRQLEEAFEHEIRLERARAQQRIHSAQRRTQVRRVQRRQKRSTMRWVLLVLSLIGTAVLVTVVMFQVLYMLLG
jgi:predicted anti-sigma-YlaC factor YlaD